MTTWWSIGRWMRTVPAIVIALTVVWILPQPLPLSATPPVENAVSRLYFPLLLHSREQPLARSTQVGGAAWVVRLAGHLAFVGVGFQLRVLDVTDMAKPRELARIDLDAAVSEIAVSGGRAFVQAGGTVSIYRWDGSSLQVVGQIQQYGLMSVASDTVVFAMISELVVYDASDPTRPRLVGSVELPAIYSSGPDYPCGLSLVGGSVYVSYSRVLMTVDIRDPAHPAVLGASQALSVCPLKAFDGGLTGLSYGDLHGRALVVVDPSDPARWSWATTHVCDDHEPQDIAVQSRTVMVLCDGSPAAIELYLLELGRSPLWQLARLTLGASDGWGSLRSASMDGGRLAAVNGGAQLTLLDASDLRAPRVTYRDGSFGVAAAVAARGDGAWVIMLPEAYNATASDLVYLDLANPAIPRSGLTVRLAGAVTALTIVGDRVVVAGTAARGVESFLSLVARHGHHWREVQRVVLDGPPGALIALGNHVAVQIGRDSAQLFQVSPLAGLVPGAKVPAPGSVQAMAADAGYLYLYGRLPDRVPDILERSYVAVVDVADPERPLLRGWRMDGVPAYIEGLVAGGGRAYIGNGWPSAVTVLDTRDATNPSVAAVSKVIGTAAKPRAVVGRLLLVDSPLRVVDFSDPKWPQPWSMDGPDTSGSTGLAVAGPSLLVAEGTRGLTLIPWLDRR
jgi:hypothetical protein